MADEKTLRRIAGDFAQCPVRPDLWMPTIVEMADATGSERGELVGFGPDGALFNWVSRLDPGMTAHFHSFDNANPRVNYRIGAAMRSRPLRLVHEAHYDAVLPTLISNDYVDFCRQWDILHGCQSTILVTADSLIGLSVLRTERDGRTTAAQREAFAAMIPAVSAAVRMQIAIEHQGHELLIGAMDAVGAQAFVLDAHGIVRAMSPSAEALVSRADCLRLVRGRLRGRLREDDARLNAAIDRTAARGAPARSNVTVALSGAAGGQEPLVVEVLPLPSAPWSLGFRPSLLVVARGSRRRPGLAPLLTSAYGLTEAEAAIAEQLAYGVSRGEIAQSRGVALVTVRAQLRAIFEKLGVSREAELVAKLNAGMA